MSSRELASEAVMRRAWMKAVTKNKKLKVIVGPAPVLGSMH